MATHSSIRRSRALTHEQKIASRRSQYCHYITVNPLASDAGSSCGLDMEPAILTSVQSGHIGSSAGLGPVRSKQRHSASSKIRIRRKRAHSARLFGMLWPMVTMPVEQFEELVARAFDGIPGRTSAPTSRMLLSRWTTSVLLDAYWGFIKEFPSPNAATATRRPFRIASRSTWQRSVPIARPCRKSKISCARQ